MLLKHHIFQLHSNQITDLCLIRINKHIILYIIYPPTYKYRDTLTFLKNEKRTKSIQLLKEHTEKSFLMNLTLTQTTTHFVLVNII